MITLLKREFLILILLMIAGCTSETKESFYSNGKLKSKLSYKNDKLNGKCVWYFENGNKELEASYIDNKLQDVQTRWYKNGKMESQVNYINGTIQGKAIYFDTEGNKVIEENYLNDTLHGDYRQYYYNGVVQIEGVYNKGHYEGSWVYYDENGNVVGNGNFTAGSGVQKAWWPNGQLKRETNYLDNKKHGLEKWFDESGKPEKELLFNQGMLVPLKHN